MPTSETRTVTPSIPEREAAEVERRVVAFYRELRPSGEVGQMLVRHAAVMSVRMERCVAHEQAASIERVRRAIAEFVPPIGVSEAEAARLRAEAGTLALFDSSKEATLARKYEAAAERGFFRALKELRTLERSARSAEDAAIAAGLGSILPGAMTDEEFDSLCASEASSARRPTSNSSESGRPKGARRRVDASYAAGRRR